MHEYHSSGYRIYNNTNNEDKKRINGNKHETEQSKRYKYFTQLKTSKEMNDYFMKEFFSMSKEEHETLGAILNEVIEAEESSYKTKKGKWTQKEIDLILDKLGNEFRYKYPEIVYFGHRNEVYIDNCPSLTKDDIEGILEKLNIKADITCINT